MVVTFFEYKSRAVMLTQSLENEEVSIYKNMSF